MSLLDRMNYKECKLDKLEVTQPNVIENDLLYVTSVLERIDQVIGMTYGPKAGNVAYQVSYNNEGFAYTKDGMTSLEKMCFMHDTDNSILDTVRRTAKKIKDTSGDGSTTATKLIYNLIKFAANDIYEKLPDIQKLRINTPKAIEILIKLVLEEIDRGAKKQITYQDLRDTAFIALNNNEFLLEPINELVDFMEANNSPIDDTLVIAIDQINGDKIKINKKPGFTMKNREFIVSPDIKEFKGVKIILINDELNPLSALLVKDLCRFASENTDNIPILFIASGVDFTIRELLREEKMEYLRQKKNWNCDFLELDYLYQDSGKVREDLAKLTNAQVVRLHEYSETRINPNEVIESGAIIKGNRIDRDDNNRFLKWKVLKTSETKEKVRVIDGEKVTKEEVTPVWDYDHFRLELYEKMIRNLEGTVLVDIEFRDGLGLVLYPQDGQPKAPGLDEHIARLVANSKSDQAEVSKEAKARLLSLRDNFYLIGIPNRGVDTDRLWTAYRDAAKSLTSIARYGYHMGGSVSAYLTILKLEIQMETELQKIEAEKLSTMDIDSVRKTRLREETYSTARYILGLLNNAYSVLIKSLLPADMTVSGAFKNGYINFRENIFGDTRVISPIETDKVMLEHTLLLFSQIFSSLAIEVENPTSIIHIKNMNNQIDERLNPKPKEEVEVPSYNPNPMMPPQFAYGIPNMPVMNVIPQNDPNSATVITSSTSNEGTQEIELTEKTPEEEHFEEVEKEFRDRIQKEAALRSLQIFSNNVKVDESTPEGKKVDTTHVIKRIEEGLAPKQLSNKVRIEGYVPTRNIKQLGRLINEAQRKEQEEQNKSQLLR